MQCTQFLVYINRFCEYTIVNMYLLIIVYYVRSMFHFGKEREEKSEKNIKIPRFFPPKKKTGMPQENLSRNWEEEQYIPPLHSHTPKTLCMEILCAWNVKTMDILIWRIWNIFMHKMWTFLCPMWIIIPRNDIFR